MNNEELEAPKKHILEGEEEGEGAGGGRERDRTHACLSRFYLATRCIFVVMVQICQRAIFENGFPPYLPKTSWDPHRLVFSDGFPKAAHRGWVNNNIF